MLFVLLCLSFSFVSFSQSEPYTLTWRDNFESLDNWVIDVMPGADSGNQEWEYYTNSSDNVFIGYDEGTGETMLVLQALAQEYEGYNFTSGKVYSKNQVGPNGFYNVRANVPHGLGLWPAIWMLPITHNLYGTWAACGEIDLMETVCFDSNSYATLHFGGPYPANVQTPENDHNLFPMPIDWSQPHNYGFEWHEDHVQFWFDAEVVEGEIIGENFFWINSTEWYSTNAAGVRFPGTAPFDAPTNIVLNVAIGGWWPCSVPDCCTDVESQLPAQMEVYWVEMWETESEKTLPHLS